MHPKYYLLTAGMVFLAGAASQPQPATPNAAAATTAAAALAQPAAKTSPAVPAAKTGEAALVQAALEALGPSAPKLSDPTALKLAFQAYYAYRAAHAEDVKNPYLYFVDYGLSNSTKRGWVFDMSTLTLVDGPFTVAHGRGSSKQRNGVPTRFTNAPGSASTSLGLYVTEETYGFSGKSGGQYYTSVGLRLRGVSGRFNSTARARGVVAHGAPYVTPAQAGRSEGCPAMEQARARRLLPKIANGGLVFLYSPADEGWVHADPWANAPSVVAAS